MGRPLSLGYFFLLFLLSVQLFGRASAQEGQSGALERVRNARLATELAEFGRSHGDPRIVMAAARLAAAANTHFVSRDDVAGTLVQDAYRMAKGDAELTAVLSAMAPGKYRGMPGVGVESAAFEIPPGQSYPPIRLDCIAGRTTIVSVKLGDKNDFRFLNVLLDGREHLKAINDGDGQTTGGVDKRSGRCDVVLSNTSATKTLKGSLYADQE